MEQFNDNATRLHYDLRLQLDPASQFIAVSGSLVYHSPNYSQERARFYLHRQLDIQSLNGRRVAGYHYEKNHAQPAAGFLAEAGTLDIYFNPPLDLGSTALVQFEYQGHLYDWPENSANVISRNWVELGQHLPWYPMQFDGSPVNLTFSLQVSCPPGYEVASHGVSAQQGDTWFFNWNHPTNDIVVVASRDLSSYTYESESNRVLLHSSTFGENTAGLLGEDLLWTLDRFAGWFGPVRPAEFTLIESPRAAGGGYARRGLVVLSGVNEHDYTTQREAYLRYLAHEAAHAWWWGAPTNSWEDWLNESFAEYSALMAIRERYGAEMFMRLLDRKRELTTGTPPLWGFERPDKASLEMQEQTDAQLYHKGPILLYELSERVGNRQFLDLCRGMQWSGVRTTSHFLDLLEELEGKNTRDWMESALKTREIE